MKETAVIVVLDEVRALVDVAGAVLRCPGCGGQLRQWGFARIRPVRSPGGACAPLRPRRVRCASCAGTHVLLPAIVPARHAYSIDVVGQALLAAAAGRSHHVIGAELGVPPDTVRGWIRRVRARAQWLRAQATSTAHAFDPELAPILPAGSILAEAVCALGAAASAVARRLGPIASPWQFIAMIARGQLLAPLPSG